MIYFKDLEENDMFFISNLLNGKDIASALHNERLDYKGWLKVYLKYWKNDADEKHFVILDGETPAGWLKINGLEDKDAAWISMLIISPERQRRGIGGRAVLFAEDFVKNLGFRTLRVKTTEDNVNAKRLYEKCGYKMTGHGEGVSGDGALRVFYTFTKELK